MEEVLKHLQSIYPMSPKLLNNLLEIIKVKEYAKGKFLLKEGSISNNIYFLIKGLLRSYYMINDQEVSSWFMKESDIVISVKSFYTQTISVENIQTLEDSVVAFISYSDLQYLYHNYLEFNFIGRVLTEKYYVQSEDRLFSIRKQKGIERYRFLLKNHPDLFQRVPSKYLASYLGVSIETLSRLKKQSKGSQPDRE